jgi:hypothetical protein
MQTPAAPLCVDDQYYIQWKPTETIWRQNILTNRQTYKPTLLYAYFIFIYLFKKALTVLHGPLAYPNGLLDLHIETFW